jgi:hypothetical protein
MSSSRREDTSQDTEDSGPAEFRKKDSSNESLLLTVSCPLAPIDRSRRPLPWAARRRRGERNRADPRGKQRRLPSRLYDMARRKSEGPREPYCTPHSSRRRRRTHVRQHAGRRSGRDTRPHLCGRRRDIRDARIGTRQDNHGPPCRDTPAHNSSRPQCSLARRGGLSPWHPRKQAAAASRARPHASLESSSAHVVRAVSTNEEQLSKHALAASLAALRQALTSSRHIARHPVSLNGRTWARLCCASSVVGSPIRSRVSRVTVVRFIGFDLPSFSNAGRRRTRLRSGRLGVASLGLGSPGVTILVQSLHDQSAEVLDPHPSSRSDGRTRRQDLENRGGELSNEEHVASCLSYLQTDRAEVTWSQ